jgi:hypothetical protein
MRPLRQGARAERGAHDAAPYAASRHHRPHAPRRLRRPDRKSDAHAHSTTDGITATRDSGALSARRQRAVARRAMTGFYLTVDGRSADCHGERQFAIAELAGRPSTGAAPFGRCRARCGARMAVATACWRPGRNLADTRGCGRGGAVLGAGGAGVADDFAPAIALARLKLRSFSSIFHLARSPDARDPPHPRRVCHAAWLACGRDRRPTARREQSREPTPDNQPRRGCRRQPERLTADLRDPGLLSAWHIFIAPTMKPGRAAGSLRSAITDQVEQAGENYGRKD